MELPVQDEQGKLQFGKVTYYEDMPVFAKGNTEFASSVVYLIESGGADYSKVDLWSFKQACKRNNVTCKELIDAYWKAYQDPYVGKEGIQFRHLWKHIEKSRTGTGDRLYSYAEMLNIVDKEKLDTDHFEMVKGQDGQPLWRRK